MEAVTRQHLDTARRNRDVGVALLHPRALLGLRPPPLEWAVVIAFYGAVHYVNGYLWETRRYEPPDHGARRTAVRHEQALHLAYRSYARLRDLAYYARYRPNFRVTRERAEQAVREDLARVERSVLTALQRLSS